MWVKTGDLSKEEVVEALAIYAIEKLNAARQINLKVDTLLIQQIRLAIKIALLEMEKGKEPTNILKSLKIGKLELKIMVDLNSVNQSIGAGFHSDTYDLIYAIDKEKPANLALQGKVRESSALSPTSTRSSIMTSPTPPVIYYSKPNTPSPLTLSPEEPSITAPDSPKKPGKNS